MKYTILIDQRAAIENGWDIDFTDLAILDYVKEFIASGGCQPVETPAGIFYWVSHTLIMKGLPLLRITTRQGIIKRMENLLAAGLLEKSQDCQKMTKTLYRIGPSYTKLFFNDVEPVNQSLQGCKPQFTGSVNESLQYKNNNKVYHNLLFEEAGPAAQPAKLHTFISSPIGTYEAWETMFNQEAEAGIDLVYYFNQVSDWARGKTGTAPKKKADWALTVRNWLRRDRQAGKLVMTTNEKISW